MTQVQLVAKQQGHIRFMPLGLYKADVKILGTPDMHLFTRPQFR